MIRTTLAQIAEATRGRVEGDDTLAVHGPAVVDSRRVVPGSLFVAIPGERVDGNDFVGTALDAGAVASLATREVPGPHVLVDEPVHALGLLATDRLAALRRGADVTVVAVTGSQGKTSVKDLMAHVLSTRGATVAPEGSFNNELGVPLTVLRADEGTRNLVLEMGARGIGHIATLCAIAPPDVAVVLNVGSAHAGEFGGLDRTAQAKGELVEALGPDGIAVLNADDPRVAAMASRTRGRVVTFGRAGDVRLVGDVTLDEDGYPHFVLEVDGERYEAAVPQLGDHQAMNAAAAVAATTAAGVPVADAVAALAGAHAASPMRMERHRTSTGAVVINDAYNANPESMSAALRTLAELAPGRGVAVLGEMLELGEESPDQHRRIGRLAADLGIARVVAVGAAAADIAEGAGPVGESVPDVETAVTVVSASLDPDAVVLVKASRGARLERVAEALLRD
ncbi:UDP-N-acetylmuramoyl-tripeptide--D-alanyl-D-alanine ligase [Aeromicrobium sp. 636]|uniref:UDP-N-acetylmuramoyl-tripeptide--D-alanyl-D-alanine ligase n=1 Tax=Aeromicrobium senzhongii TaxID=2663859 RepID=A0A8I0EU81_9ACTN|nr:UDP-N-acetylmuramoyl-tripeptide--D-alanyl-D-alanine ligase [Aeromicrobium sp. 636]MBC9225447.1 UDP-N-acetylmuramoyl-tripeptide--D-alanyl-D-alanine ligase [Aeromicrobium senzhongii]MCQ3997557.1 UDP-N-acetylmuramoyl-tripeptide--D-alanyl-D-alanine ligase [Aeromicrobium sp. 636]